MSGLNDDSVHAVEDLAQRAAAPKPIDQTTLAEHPLLLAAIPDGSTLHFIETETYLPQPRTMRGHASFDSPQSFARYVNLFKGPGSHVFASAAKGAITAVFDGHVAPTSPDGVVAGTPGWGRLTASYSPTQSPEWALWMRSNGVFVDQEKFAYLMEEGAPDIVAPDAATMLELAQTFLATRQVDYRSSKRIDSGLTQLLYQETGGATAGHAGEIEIPAELVLRLRPYEGMEPQQFRARFRHRLTGTKLLLAYEILRPDDILTAAFDAIVDQIATDTEITPFRGTWSAPRADK